MNKLSRANNRLESNHWVKAVHAVSDHNKAIIGGFENVLVKEPRELR